MRVEVTRVESGLLEMSVLERVAPVIRNTAHPLRLRILDYLRSECSGCTVTAITQATDSVQAVVSQQLRILKDLGILVARRDRGYVYYSIANPSVLLILDCIRAHESGQGCRVQQRGQTL